MKLAESEVRFWSARDHAPLGGYVVWPTLLPSLPPVVLIPDVQGIDEVHRQAARQLASEGFLVMLFNPYTRTGPPDLPDAAAAQTWMQTLPDSRMLSDIGAAVSFVLGHDRVRQTTAGIAGFGMGGQYAFMAACMDARIRACVTWHALLRYEDYTVRKPVDPLDMSPDLLCPYLGFFGAEDDYVPASDVDELKALLKHYRKSFEIDSFPKTGHDFFLPSLNGMPCDAAERSWPRALSFLHRHLGH